MDIEQKNRLRRLTTVANAHGLLVEQHDAEDHRFSVVWIYGVEDSVELKRFHVDASWSWQHESHAWDQALDAFETWLDGFTAGKEIG